MARVVYQFVAIRIVTRNRVSSWNAFVANLQGLVNCASYGNSHDLLAMRARFIPSMVKQASHKPNCEGGSLRSLNDLPTAHLW